MSEALRLQDPGDTVDHTLDWSDWLAAGDTIATSTWAVSPQTGGLPDISSTAPTSTGTTATVWVKAVVFGQIYEVTNTIVTNGGRTGRRSFTLRGWKE